MKGLNVHTGDVGADDELALRDRAVDRDVVVLVDELARRAVVEVDDRQSARTLLGPRPRMIASASNRSKWIPQWKIATSAALEGLVAEQRPRAR